MKKTVSYQEAKNLYNEGKIIVLSDKIKINNKDGVNLQWGNETDFDFIVDDYKFWNKKMPIFKTT